MNSEPTEASLGTAPRVTTEHIASLIVEEHFFTAGQGAYGSSDWAKGLAGPMGEEGRKPGPLDLLTFCVLVLRNGFTVVGQSACASPENFNAEIGRQIARKDAIEKIWPLEGYLLRQRLHDNALLPQPTGSLGAAAEVQA